jgi:RNA polymerase sigma-70 factor, ECF subfamily
MTPLTLDQIEFENIYREHHPHVLATCRRMLGSSDQAEDAANDVFARLPAALQTYDPAQPLSRWISRVAGNYCIDLLRRRRAELRLIEPASPSAPDPLAPAPSPLHDLLCKEEAEAVRDALFSLPERYLVPLVMRYYSELSYEEIAEALGTRRSSVAVLIFRAKQRLRKSLAHRPQQTGSSGPGRTTRRPVQGASAWLHGPLPIFSAP